MSCSGNWAHSTNKRHSSVGPPRPQVVSVARTVRSLAGFSSSARTAENSSFTRQSPLRGRSRTTKASRGVGASQLRTKKVLAYCVQQGAL